MTSSPSYLPPFSSHRSLLAALALLAAAADLPAAENAAEPLRACATVPDLGDLLERVAGESARMTVFAKGTEDAHFVEPKPSFIKDLHDADMFLQIGMELETGWAPVLLRNARNSAILPGGQGYIDASVVIAPLEVPMTAVDRSMGDVHPQGNPHYLLDPLNAVRVAQLLRDRLAARRPQDRALFDERCLAFTRSVHAALVGEALAAKYDAAKLALLFEHGALASFLEQQGDRDALGGWLGRMLPHFGVKAFADHNLWPYFARRFGLVMAGSLEPKPGISPTTKHLGELVQLASAQQVALILAAPYYDVRHARFVAAKTGAAVVPMAHQVGSRPGTDDYVKMIDYDVDQIVTALEKRGQ